MNVLNRAGVQNIYNHKVRINNWSEDQELHELRIKEYLHRKSHGTLLVHQVQKHLASSLQQVGLTYSRDGYVHIGDHVMLYSVATEGVLSTDISDKPHPSHIAVTTSTLTQAHVARNTFIIEAYGNQSKEGDLLKLGQPFRLRINPKLSNEAFYLHSAPVSASSSSKVSRQQEVTMCSANAGYDTVWKVQWRDIAQRFEMEGQGVPANAEVIIVHAQTQHALASDKLNYYNDFGLEYEVSSHTHMSIAKTQGLYAELHGKTTTDIPVRKEAAPNHWAFLTAAVPEMENMLNEQEVKVDVGTLLSSLRDNIMSRGPTGVHAVYKAFRVLDKDKQDILSEDAFRHALKNVDINLSDDEFIALCGVFDTQHDRTVNYHQFLTKIRGPISARRTRLISKLFDTIDTSSNGVITIDQLIRVFNPNTHLDVRQKKVTAATLIQQLTDAFNGLNRDRTITRDEFHDYYASIGAFVEHDDYFALQICNSYPVKE